MKLDRAGIDYIVAVAADAGFKLRRCETTEEYEYHPKVTLLFEQTREPRPPEPPAKELVDINAWQAAELAKEAKEKSARTLDE